MNIYSNLIKVVDTKNDIQCRIKIKTYIWSVYWLSLFLIIIQICKLNRI